MILTDKEILNQIGDGNVVIRPFIREHLGSNSYDVTLHSQLVIYEDFLLDTRKDNKYRVEDIPEEGFILYPGILYLGSTVEYTETHYLVPFVEGRSSSGRLGISIHATAGKGDIGFCGHWTLEITVTQPVRIYAGMRIGQIIYFATQGEVGTTYGEKANNNYNNQSILPKTSNMFKSFK